MALSSPWKRQQQQQKQQQRRRRHVNWIYTDTNACKPTTFMVACSPQYTYPLTESATLSLCHNSQMLWQALNGQTNPTRLCVHVAMSMYSSIILTNTHWYKTLVYKYMGIYCTHTANTSQQARRGMAQIHTQREHYSGAECTHPQSFTVAASQPQSYGSSTRILIYTY